MRKVKTKPIGFFCAPEVNTFNLNLEMEGQIVWFLFVQCLLAPATVIGYRENMTKMVGITELFFNNTSFHFLVSVDRWVLWIGGSFGSVGPSNQWALLFIY